jgi:hypothetical protein
MRIIPSVAPLRHPDRLRSCLFIGVDRKRSANGQSDAIDPEPAFPSASARDWRDEGASRKALGECHVACSSRGYDG